jgi:hypothetical protein
LFRTTDRGLNWEKVTADGQFHRVSSLTFTDSGWHMTTEGQGLWLASPNFLETWYPVESYPFHHPERVFNNPYVPQEAWVASFGNGMRSAYLGDVNASNPIAAPSAKVNVLQNPISESIVIEVIMDKAAVVNFRLINMQGQIVQDFHSRNLMAGKQNLSFLGKDLPTGNYLFQMTLPTGEVITSKISAQR